MANWIEGVTFQDSLQLNPTINWDFFVDVQEAQLSKQDTSPSLDICAEALRLTFDSSACLDTSAFDQYLGNEQVDEDGVSHKDIHTLIKGCDGNGQQKGDIETIQAEETQNADSECNQHSNHTIKVINTAHEQVENKEVLEYSKEENNKSEVDVNDVLIKNVEYIKPVLTNQEAKNESLCKSIILDQTDSISEGKSDSSVNDSYDRDVSSSSSSADNSNDSTTWMPTPCTNDPTKNPQIPYIELCAAALLSSKEGRMLLTDIYSWVMDKFPYFQTALCAWRNSVRHALCVNECFIKAARAPVGRGFYWAIHPACLEDFKKGDFNRRQARKRVQEALRNMDNPPAKRQRTNAMSPKGAEEAKSSTINASSYTHTTDNKQDGKSPTNAYKSHNVTNVSPTHTYKARNVDDNSSPTNVYHKQNVTYDSPVHAYTAYKAINDNNISPTHSNMALTNSISPVHAYRTQHHPQVPLSSSTPFRDNANPEYHPAYTHMVSPYGNNYNTISIGASGQLSHHTSPVYSQNQSCRFTSNVTEQAGTEQGTSVQVNSNHPASPVFSTYHQSNNRSNERSSNDNQYNSYDTYNHTFNTTTQYKQSDSGYTTCLSSPYSNAWAAYSPYNTTYHTPQAVSRQYSNSADYSNNTCTYAL